MSNPSLSVRYRRASMNDLAQPQPQATPDLLQRQLANVEQVGLQTQGVLQYVDQGDQTKQDDKSDDDTSEKFAFARVVLEGMLFAAVFAWSDFMKDAFGTLMGKSAGLLAQLAFALILTGVIVFSARVLVPSNK